MTSEDFINEKLQIYLNYEFLPADQYSNIISAINEIYTTIQKYLTVYDLYVYEGISYAMINGVPLCIQEVHTGNSIEIKLSFKKQLFPEMILEKGDLNIILPYWTAVLILTGMVVSYGMDKYEKYLDIQLKRMDLEEKTKEHLIKQSSELKDLKNDPLNPTTVTIQQNVYRFQTQIYQPNITIVTINGQEVHNKLDNNKLQ